jgi:hypothetical protein
MVNTIVDGTFRQTNLTNESSEYLAKREELRLAEIELMRQRERLAELRRHLPQGAPIQDYAFEEGPRDLNGGANCFIFQNQRDADEQRYPAPLSRSYPNRFTALPDSRRQAR